MAYRFLLCLLNSPFSLYLSFENTSIKGYSINPSIPPYNSPSSALGNLSLLPSSPSPQPFLFFLSVHHENWSDFDKIQDKYITKVINHKMAKSYYHKVSGKLIKLPLKTLDWMNALKRSLIFGEGIMFSDFEGLFYIFFLPKFSLYLIFMWFDILPMSMLLTYRNMMFFLIGVMGNVVQVLIIMEWIWRRNQC